jgi:hypothetical protein
MAQTTTISLKELKRQTSLIFEGQEINVMLCNIGFTTYDQESSVADWSAQEISGSGYSTFQQTVGASTYNEDTGLEEVPEIIAEFTATGGPLNYDRVVIFFTGETYIHSLVVEDPNVVVADGQTQTYSILLTQND